MPDSRFSVPSHSTNDLKVTNVQLSDSGTFTCIKEKYFRKVELLVIQVSVNPSADLISSEDLELTIKSSPGTISGLQVTWKKDGESISRDSKLLKKNVQLVDSGSYVCHVKIDGANDVTIDTRIAVKGVVQSSAIVYMAGKHPITLPWIFNFKVRQIPLANEVGTVGGNIAYQSKIIKELTVTSMAASWPETTDLKTPPEQLYNLSVSLSNPNTGHYEMAITLKIGGREKTLLTHVCLAKLAVSASHSGISMESTVNLLCNVTCIDKDHKLCWYHLKIGQEFCGQAGKSNFSKEVTVLPETVGDWTCGVVVGEERKVSANLELEAQPIFLDMSNYLVWVAVGVGVLVLLLIVVTITIMTARCRRMRRARYRAWLLQNIHQQRRCQCKGFASKLLKENM
ncbi:T-cell surface glycoprotein CD4-like [Mixophyes fleayi]|uniref:T-cell surface glycoprotein CD4-like n=1 Tax=Mixophyes fleayi TaxID=3061075 RepID=UPI003F4D7B92